MGRALFAVAAVVLLAVAVGAAAAVGVGPFARGAARSVVYVAISRSTESCCRRRLLVLDAATGKVTRTLPLAGVPARLTR